MYASILFRVSKMVAKPEIRVNNTNSNDLLRVEQGNYTTSRSLPSLDLEDLQEWVESAGDD
jgi:hypothetical protein